MTVLDRTYGTLTIAETLLHGGTVGRAWHLDLEPHVAVCAKRIFTRAGQNRRGQVTVTDTLDSAQELDMLLHRYPLRVDAAARAALDARLEQARTEQEAVLEILTGNRALGGDDWLTPAVEPRDYQRQAADVVLANSRTLVVDDLGLGKTFTGLLLLRDPRARPGLVVAPTHLAYQWLEELHKFFPMLRGTILKGTKPYDPARGLHGYDPDVLITTYSRLDGWRDYLTGRVRSVVFDEMQELRRSGSLKYVAAGQIADKARYRMGLTATPVYNHGGEIFNLVEILEPGALGTRREFQIEWGGEDRMGRTMVSDPAALGTYLRDRGLMIRRTRKDVARELPPVTTVTHTVDCDRERLDDMADEITALARVILSSPDRKERFTASGDLDWRLRQETGLAKAPHVSDFVRFLLESEDKLLLFGWHRAVYDLWLSELRGYRPVLYTGSESPAGKQRARDEFISGDSRVLIMSLRSGAGVNGLQEVARTLVFGELDWSPGVHEQCIGRLARDGMDVAAPVVAYYLVTDDGSDPVIAETLGIKRQQMDGITDPDGRLFEPVTDDGDRMRRLAQRVLDRRDAT